MTPTRLLPILFALLGGCNNGTEDGPVGVEDPLARYPGACALWAQGVCVKDEAQQSNPVTDRCGSDEGRCLSRQAAFCEELFAEKEVAQPMDVPTVEACAAAVKLAYADAVLDLQEYKLVMRLEGGACGELAETGAGGGGAVAPIPAGYPCPGMPADSCVPGFFCNGSDCVLRKAPGEPCCENELSAEPCAPSEVLCIESSVCMPGAQGSSCFGRGTLPECHRDIECRDDQVCVLDPSDPTTGGRCTSEIALNPFDPTCNAL